MKYSMEQYLNELEKARKITCGYDEIREIMAPYREALYQGLEVGDGVTINLWSDCHAGTIIKRTRCKLWIQRDTAVRVDNNGISENQEYEFYPNPNGTIYEAYWSRKHKAFFLFDNSISVGRHEYYDYSF